jgi:hypothetical protein
MVIFGIAALVLLSDVRMCVRAVVDVVDGDESMTSSSNSKSL